MLSKNGSGFFRGKRIRTDVGASTEILNLRYGQPMSLTVQSTQGFHRGDVFHYDDVQPGDQFSIILTASLTQTAPGTYEFRGQLETTIVPPSGQDVLIKR